MARVILPTLVVLAVLARWFFSGTPTVSNQVDVLAAVKVDASDEPDVTPTTDNQLAPPPAWVLAVPPSITTETPSAQNPCMIADRGFGTYEQWERLPEGQLLWPKNPAVDTESGDLRVLFHFHGHEAVRKEWVRATSDVVLVALDLGDSSSAYAQEFNDPQRFASLMANVEEVLARRLGHSVAIERFALSAWSAGYAAVRAILGSDFKHRVDSVVLLDGLHTSTLESVAGRDELAPFVDFAQRAAGGDVLMFVSHSSINPPDYVSSTQAISYLIWKLDGEPTPPEDFPPLAQGLVPYRRFDRQGFHAVGFPGVTKEDHCAQVQLYPHVLRTFLLPRWGVDPVPVADQ